MTAPESGMRRWTVLAAAVLLAFILGYFVRGGGKTPAAPEEKKETVWTCSMHPQIRLPNPGKCPICSMPLIPAETSGGGDGEPMLKLSDHARAMASVETVHVTKRKLTKEIRVVGKIQANETTLATVTSRVDGYVERLFVDYTGMSVEKGDHLVELYSPDLVVAQKELLLSAEHPENASHIEASKLKLLRWEITDAQITELLKTKKIQERMTIYSPVKGTVVEKTVVEKSPVKAGDALYRLANLETLWVHLDIYEYEYVWVQYGQPVEIKAEAFPGQTSKGMVSFISPTLNEETRTIRVRVIVMNADGKLKPGMFVSAIIRVPLLSDGKPAPTGVQGKFTCPMHPEILKDKAGTCDICGMALKQIPAGPARPGEHYTCPMHPEVVRDKPGDCPKCGMILVKVQGSGSEILVVPVTAVLDSGLRKLVYVERAKGEFVPTEVTLGPRAGDYFPVLGGLQEYDAVAVRGNFLIDSQFQIQGMPSLLNKEGAAPVTGHGGHGGPTPPSETKRNSSSEKPDHSGHRQ